MRYCWFYPPLLCAHSMRQRTRCSKTRMRRRKLKWHLMLQQRKSNTTMYQMRRTELLTLSFDQISKYYNGIHTWTYCICKCYFMFKIFLGVQNIQTNSEKGATCIKPAFKTCNLNWKPLVGKSNNVPESGNKKAEERATIQFSESFLLNMSGTSRYISFLLE